MYTISSSAALYVTMLILPPKHFDIHLAKSQFLDMFVTCYIDEYSLILWLPYCHRHTPFSQRLSTYSAPQSPRIDLNKRFLPRPNTTTAWKLIPHKSNISKYVLKSYTLGTFLLSKLSLDVNAVKLFLYYVVKTSFWKLYVVGPNVEDFNSCWF